MKSNVLSVFISECFEHVYKELNGEADTLRKEGLSWLRVQGYEVKSRIVISYTKIFLHPRMGILMTVSILKMIQVPQKKNSEF